MLAGAEESLLLPLAILAEPPISSFPPKNPRPRRSVRKSLQVCRTNAMN